MERIFLGKPPEKIIQWIINKYSKEYTFTYDDNGNAYINGNNLDPNCVVVNEELDENRNLFVEATKI